MSVGLDLMATVALCGRVCVGLIFVVAGLQKASHWHLLPGVIANYRLLPAWAVTLSSLLLPPIEATLGVFLLLAVLEPWSVLTGMAVLGLFALAMTINIVRGRIHIDCGCGDSFLRQTLSVKLVARNLALVILLCPSLVMLRPTAMPLLLSGIAAGIGLFLLYLLFNVVVSLPSLDKADHLPA